MYLNYLELWTSNICVSCGLSVLIQLPNDGLFMCLCFGWSRRIALNHGNHGAWIAMQPIWVQCWFHHVMMLIKRHHFRPESLMFHASYAPIPSNSRTHRYRMYCWTISLASLLVFTLGALHMATPLIVGLWGQRFLVHRELVHRRPQEWYQRKVNEIAWEHCALVFVYSACFTCWKSLFSWAGSWERLQTFKQSNFQAFKEGNRSDYILYVHLCTVYSIYRLITSYYIEYYIIVCMLLHI